MVFSRETIRKPDISRGKSLNPCVAHVGFPGRPGEDETMVHAFSHKEKAVAALVPQSALERRLFPNKDAGGLPDGCVSRNVLKWHLG